MKTQEQKNLLLEQFKKTPIVQVACEKTGLSRATYYRWRKQDHKFEKHADEALSEGSLLINDLAESQLIGAIKDKNLGAIIFWLKTHHKDYGNKLELTGRLRVDESLSAEQKAMIKRALKLATITSPPSIVTSEDDTEDIPSLPIMQKQAE